MTPWYLGAGSVGAVGGMGVGFADWVRFRAQSYRVVHPAFAAQGQARPAEVDTRFGAAPATEPVIPNNLASQTDAALTIKPWTDAGSLPMQQARYEAAARIGPFRAALLDVFA